MGQQRTQQMGIGTAAKWTIHAAELIAIYRTTEMIEQDISIKADTGPSTDTVVTIVSDSQSAIQMIANPYAKSGQAIALDVVKRIEALRARRVKINLQWPPAHYGNLGNKTAYRLAEQAVSLQEDHHFRQPLQTLMKSQHRKIEEEWQQGWAMTQNSKHVKSIHRGPPSRRALRLYGSLTRHQAHVSAQLRTGHSWLASEGLSRRFRGRPVRMWSGGDSYMS